MIYSRISPENTLHTVNLITTFTYTNLFLLTHKTEILKKKNLIEYNVKNKECLPFVYANILQIQ